MIVYEATKQLFIEDVVQDRIEKNIDRKFYEKMGYHTSESERKAWNNSMQYMMKVLIDNNIPGNVGIAIEFKIPNTSKRVDFIITGKDGKFKNTAIIVELKQWTEANIVNGKDGIVQAFTGYALREVTHPSYQAWSYATTIEDYNETVQDRRIDLHPCAYLHNYLTVTPPTLLSDNYKYYLEKAPAFIKGDIEKLREHFNFEITDYIIDDILDYETYRHTCLMINLAVINNRISIENGEILKAGLKIIFKIKNEYDRFNRNIYIDTFDFDSWYDKYSTEEIVDIKKFLNTDDINLLKKLNIKIKNKIYTEQEVEILNMDLLSYYIADDMDDEELKQSKLLPKDVNREEYNKLLDKINRIPENSRS